MTGIEIKQVSDRSIGSDRNNRFIRSRLSLGSISWRIFVVLWLISFVDISGDYAVFHDTPYWGGDILVPELRLQFQFVSTVLIGMLALFGCMALLRGKTVFRAAPEVKLFLFFFGASTVWGAFIGWIKGVPSNYIIGDSRNVVVYLLLFAVGGAAVKKVENLRRLFLIGGGILLIKLFYSFAAHLASGAGLSWRSLLKQSPMFIPMLFVAFGGLVYSRQTAEKRRNALLEIMAAIGIFAAQSRGFFMGMFGAALLFIIMVANSRRIFSAFKLGLVIFGIGLGVGIILQGDITKSFGYWQKSDISPGLEYRIRQSDMLLKRFADNWQTGTGLGSFDTTYEGNADWLPRPYLYELEYHNLLAKLGIIGISFWLIAFFFLFIGCIRAVRRAIKPEHRGFAIGMMAGLISLMLGSIVQTTYSSVYFHLYVVLVLLTLSALRMPQLEALRGDVHTRRRK